MKVRDVMSKPVFTVGLTTSLSEVADVLAANRISAVPVLDAEERVVGIVSEYDLLARTGETAAQVMSADVITVSEETEIAAVRSLLIDSHLRRLPVLSGHRLVGILARADVVRLLAHEWICGVCGEAVRGQRPNRCARCGAPSTRFSEQPAAPGF
jgi:CBS domain-containing protein